MRVRIKTNGKTIFNIPIPLSLLGTKIGARIISNALTTKTKQAGLSKENSDILESEIDKSVLKLDSKGLREFVRAMKRYRREHGKFLLLEAADAEGDGVEIYL